MIGKTNFSEVEKKTFGMYIKLMHEEKILSEWFLKDKKKCIFIQKKTFGRF